MLCRFQQRSSGQLMKLDASSPASVRKIIRNGQFDRYRLRIVRERLKIQSMRGQIQRAAVTHRPAFAVRRHQVPAMNVGDVEAAGNPDVVDRSRQLSLAGGEAMDA